MKVKVHCPCGARFEFEVEPLNGRMPVPINCPTCGAEATELANAVITQQLAASPPVAPRVDAPKPRIHVSGVGAPAAKPPAPPASLVPATPSPGQSGLRISKQASAPPPAVEAEAPVEVPTDDAPVSTVENEFHPCYKHKTDPAVDNCVVCGKPICEKCRQQFGHVCSVFCREAAVHHGVTIPVYAGQRGQAEARAERKAKYAAMAVAALVALLLGAWAWYTYFARAPHVVYSFQFPKSGSYSAIYELIAPRQLLSLKGSQLTLLDLSKDTPVWSVALPDDAKTVDQSFDETTFREPRLVASTNDIWVALTGKIFRFDRANGSRKDLPLPDKISEVVAGNDAFLVVSGKSSGSQQVTRISLADGSAQSEELTSAAANSAGLTNSVMRGAGRPAAARGGSVSPAGTPATLRGLATTTTSDEQATKADALMTLMNSPEHRLVSTADGAVQFNTKLLQHLTVTHEAMKKKGASVLDDQNLTASRGVDMAEEMMNDQKRDETGGVDIEDVSRYQVTLHRMFAKGATDWTGEVSGPPRFVPLKSVDLLVAGTNLYVFDLNNKKLWDAKLTFLPRERRSYGGEDDLPCLETKDALYFADKGVLTRFDLFTGNVRWRMTTVGVSEIKTNGLGELYVDTSTAGAESIRYSQQVDLHKRVDLVIMRVDPGTGKVIWSTPFNSTSYRTIASGKFLYSTREWQTQDPLRFEDGPDNNFNIKLLKPSSGELIWNYPVTKKAVLKTEVQQNWILLQFADEVRVLKFFSF